MATQAAAGNGSATTTTTTTLLGEWLALLDREGVSARNRDAHRMGVERLAEYLSPRSVDEATATDLRGFIAYLGELGVSEQSRGVYRQILEKWVSHANEERKRAQLAAAAAAALTGAEPFQMPSASEAKPVAQDADDEDRTVVFEIGGGAPQMAPMLPDPFLAGSAGASEDVVSDEQAESTWPFAKPKPTDSPSMEGMAAVFDGATPTHPPAAPVTIDFASVDADGAYVIEAEVEEAVADAPTFTPSAPAAFAPVEAANFAPVATSAFAPVEASSFAPVETTSFAPVETTSFAPVEPTSFAPVEPTSFAPVEPTSFAPVEPTGFAPVESAFAMPGPLPSAAPPSPFGTESSFGAAPSFGMPEAAPPSSASSFGGMSMGFGGDSEATSVAADPSADATPVRPMAPAAPMAAHSMGSPSARKDAPVRDAAGDHVMHEGTSSIPLAAASIGVGAPASKSAGAAKPVASVGVAGLKSKVQAWGLRVNGTERNDLDLAQIRNMAATGALTPSSVIRKPGGEWMKAGDYQPLRSVFQQAKMMASGEIRPEAPAARDPLAHPVAMAWLGATIGAVAGACAWWFAAVVAGAEVLPMALVVGLLSGALASWLGRGESFTALGASAVATIGAMCVGRFAVFKTLKSGVIGSGGVETSDPLAFLAMSATGASLTWWGIAVALAVAVGGVGLFLRKR